MRRWCYGAPSYRFACAPASTVSASGRCSSTGLSHFLVSEAGDTLLSSGARRLGRGKALPSDEVASDEVCTMTESDYVVDTDGRPYPCCWMATASIGNVLSTPFPDLIRRESESGWLPLLRRGGPRHAAMRR